MDVASGREPPATVGHRERRVSRTVRGARHPRYRYPPPPGTPIDHGADHHHQHDRHDHDTPQTRPGAPPRGPSNRRTPRYGTAG